MMLLVHRCRIPCADSYWQSDDPRSRQITNFPSSLEEAVKAVLLWRRKGDEFRYWGGEASPGLLLAFFRSLCPGRTPAKRNEDERTHTNMTDTTAIMTTGEAAKYLRCTPDTIRRMVRRGELPAARLGLQLRIARAAIEAWVARQTSIAGGMGA